MNVLDVARGGGGGGGSSSEGIPMVIMKENRGGKRLGGGGGRGRGEETDVGVVVVVVVGHNFGFLEKDVIQITSAVPTRHHS